MIFNTGTSTAAIRRLRSLKRCLFGPLAALIVLQSCTYVPFDKDVVAMSAQTGAADMSFGAPAPGRANTYPTNIQPLRDGETSLHSRLAMMDDARDTLDISAFIIREDHAGYLIADRIVRAANRGVKVRLLLDDLFNRSTAVKFLPLDLHPNIEVRIFNPFSRLSPSAVGFLLDFDRVRRRMHSRMMVADTETAILGGRNIADEYFSDNGFAAFTDFDILVRGRVAQQFARTFGIYWSDRWTLPLRQINQWDYRWQYARLLRDIPARAKQAQAQKYPSVVTPDLALADRAGPPQFDSHTEFVTDPPSKLREDASEGLFHVAESHFRRLAQARHDILIITPYFIPEEHGTQVLLAIARRGVNVTIVTNSLASTNHVSVHGGYAAYRDRLIRAGVNFHELDAAPRGNMFGRRIQNTLHAKITIIDGTQTVITTMNFDPVSIRGNIETSVAVRGRAFARWMLQRVNPVSLKQTYRLHLDDSGAVVWMPPDTPDTPHAYPDPDADVLRRVLSLFSQIVKLETLL